MRSSKIVRILISAPSDVEEELRLIFEVIKNWNATYSEKYGVYLEGVHWITHSSPQMGERPQAILNKQIVHTSDILIAVFWSRLGSPTGEEESGTVEEIKEFIKEGKPVLLYFSNVPIPRNVNTEQLKKLNEFQDQCKKEQLGLYFEFDSLESFERKINHDIAIQISDIEIDEHDKGFSENVKKILKKDIFESNLKQYDVFIKRLGLEWKIPELNVIYSVYSPQNPYFTYLKSIEEKLWDFYKMFNYEVSEDIGKKIFDVIKIINKISSPSKGGGLSMGIFMLDPITMKKHKERVMQLLESISGDLNELTKQYSS